MKTKDALSISDLQRMIGAKVDRASLASIDGEKMGITREYLEQEIASLRQQREQHATLANMAAGAIQGFEALIAKLDQENHDGSDDHIQGRGEVRQHRVDGVGPSLNGANHVPAEPAGDGGP